VQGVFTRRVAAKEVLDHDEARSHPVIRSFRTAGFRKVRFARPRVLKAARVRFWPVNSVVGSFSSVVTNINAWPGAGTADKSVLAGTENS